MIVPDNGGRMSSRFCNAFESLAKNKYGIILMLFNSILIAASQLLFKNSVYHGLIFAALGIALQVFGTGIVMLAYKYGSFSVVSPVMSISMILAVTGGKIFFNENVTLLQMAGLAFVVVGVGLISAGDI